ncbi:MAG: S8 family serine peptidase [Candidatus Glassbacteria bacterium]
MTGDGDVTLRRCLPRALSDLKGEGVTVAVIDSGVNSGHPHVGLVDGGISLSIEEGGKVKRGEDYSDRVGHGTACAAVIRGWAPLSGILAVKILDDHLSSHTELLIEGIEWAYSSGADVINMSLGTYRGDLIQQLRGIVEKVSDSGAVLVASSHNPLNPPAPAMFPTVISVAPDFKRRSFHMGRGNGKGIDLSVYPYPREAPGIDTQLNFRGPSFASAHVAGIVCLIKERKKESNYLDVKKYLFSLLGEFAS